MIYECDCANIALFMRVTATLRCAFFFTDRGKSFGRFTDGVGSYKSVTSCHFDVAL